MQGKSASASTGAGSVTRPACATCSTRRSTSRASSSPGRRCVVVGGGEIGLEKVEGLLACDGRVVLIAPEAEPELQQAGGRGLDRVDPARVRDRRPRGDVHRDRGDQRHRRQHRASTTTPSARAMLVNVVDVPPLCNFILPAIVRTGPLAIAISTAGASPALAKRIKAQIADDLRRAVRAAGGAAQRGPRLGQGHAADLPGPQGVLRGHRQRRARPDRAAARTATRPPCAS